LIRTFARFNGAPVARLNTWPSMLEVAGEGGAAAAGTRGWAAAIRATSKVIGKARTMSQF
jgi:hypothetical protein